MEKKFTEGEWRVVNSGGKVISERKDYYVEICMLETVPLKISEEVHANARLIASAPNMFEALQSIIDYWNTPQSGSINDHINHSLKIAEKAIKKATE